MKILLIFLALTFNAVAQNSQDSSDLPRILYEQGKYSESVETLQKKPDKTAIDYFNLSNALYKLNKPNLAYAYLIKSKFQLKNHNSNISAAVDQNLKATEELLASQSQITKDVTFWQGRLIPFFNNLGSATIWSLFAIANIIFAVCIYNLKPLYKSFMKNLLQVPFFLGLFGWIFFMTAFLIGNYSISVSQAVIVSEASSARSGPSENFTELFRVLSGSIVILTGKTQNGWSQVRFSTSQIGWVLDKELLTL